ncbi:MAG TPA: histidine phosphatase family protein [Polyangiaceae bacterium]|nr:histidine phosphatase family protein [Polyangiaceae bacterium]
MPDLTIYLCRHGDTAWSAERRLAGRTDLPLIEQGERNAVQLGERLKAVPFTRVLVSPLQRARRTAELAGMENVELEGRLVEMNFGRYEGLTVNEIRRESPGWTYLREGCPEGESAEDLGRRADALLHELAPLRGKVALFAHSVMLRVLAARFLGLVPEAGRNFMLSPGSISILSHDPVEDSPVIATWNDRAHLTGQDFLP